MLALCVHICVRACVHICMHVQMMGQLGPGGTQERQREEAELEELTHGVRSYFDKCLSALLLYRSERVQAVAQLSDGRSPAAVYGAEHLLRLMLKLPEIMPTAGMTQPQVGALSAKLQVGAAWCGAGARSQPRACMLGVYVGMEYAGCWRECLGGSGSIEVAFARFLLRNTDAGQGPRGSEGALLAAAFAAGPAHVDQLQHRHAHPVQGQVC